MNKLEIISELLVNELNGFTEDVKTLKKELDRYEHLKVKFDVAPVEKFMEQLNSFQDRETKKRDNYLTTLNRRLDKAKIYPNWAVVTFLTLVMVSCVLSFYSYTVKTNAIENEKAAYVKGEMAAKEYINLYFSENPKGLQSFKKWADSK